MRQSDKLLGILAMGMALSGGYGPSDMLEPRPASKPKDPKKRPLPAGVKEFHFDEYGEKLEQGDLRIFITVKAINLKNAQRKALKLILPS